jgi:hypothetical protein
MSTTPSPDPIAQIVALVESSREWVAVVLAAVASFFAMRHRDRRNDRALSAKLELDLAAERYRLSPREEAIQKALEEANQRYLDYLMAECAERDDRIAQLEEKVNTLSEQNRSLYEKAAQYKAALSGGDNDEPTGFQRPI